MKRAKIGVLYLVDHQDVARDIVVVGASAGGVEALSSFVSKLPSNLPAAVFVVLHISPYGTSVLPDILRRSGALPARHPNDGELIRHGTVYVAPSDRHLLIEGERVRVVRGPRENGHRPAIDPLFRSAARSVGRRAIGVVLSGLLDDGTAGLLAIKRYGGLAIAQSPEEALFAGMVTSAIDHVAVDHVLPIAEIAALLPRITRGEASTYSGDAASADEDRSASAAPSGGRSFDTLGDEASTMDDMTREIGSSMLSAEQMNAASHPGTPSAFSCPDCGGVLWEIQDGSLVRFRCRTGHAYTAGILLAEQSQGLDAALWTAIRALEESASLARRLSDRARARGHNLSATRFGEQADAALARAGIVRSVLLRSDPELEGDELFVP